MRIQCEVRVTVSVLMNNAIPLIEIQSSKRNVSNQSLSQMTKLKRN